MKTSSSDPVEWLFSLPVSGDTPIMPMAYIKSAACAADGFTAVPAAGCSQCKKPSEKKVFHIRTSKNCLLQVIASTGWQCSSSTQPLVLFSVQGQIPLCLLRASELGRNFA